MARMVPLLSAVVDGPKSGNWVHSKGLWLCCLGGWRCRHTTFANHAKLQLNIIGSPEIR